MSVHRNINLIKQILANLDKDHKSSHEQFVYELGFLIGMLARMANDDNYVYYALKAELTRLEGKKQEEQKNKKDP